MIFRLQAIRQHPWRIAQQTRGLPRRQHQQKQHGQRNWCRTMLKRGFENIKKTIGTTAPFRTLLECHIEHVCIPIEFHRKASWSTCESATQKTLERFMMRATQQQMTLMFLSKLICCNIAPSRSLPPTNTSCCFDLSKWLDFKKKKVAPCGHVCRFVDAKQHIVAKTEDCWTLVSFNESFKHKKYPRQVSHMPKKHSSSQLCCNMPLPSAQLCAS